MRRILLAIALLVPTLSFGDSARLSDLDYHCTLYDTKDPKNATVVLSMGGIFAENAPQATLRAFEIFKSTKNTAQFVSNLGLFDIVCTKSESK